MKKAIIHLVALIAVFSLVLCLASCRGDTTTTIISSTTSSTTSSSTTSTTTSGSTDEGEQLKASEGLSFLLTWVSESEAYYSVIGMGTCTDTDVVIPRKHNGKPVKAIGVGAFNGNKNITSVYIPGTISVIVYCLSNCTSLESVTIEAGVKTIEYGAFSDCTSLKEVNLPDGLENIEGYAFRDCSALESIQIPVSTKNVHGRSFFNCDKLYDKENEIYYIDNWAMFADEVRSGAVQFREGTIGIASDFRMNSKRFYASSVILPDSVKYIGEKAFLNVRSMESVDLGKVEYIGYNAFNNCTRLTSVTIPSETVYISPNVFNGCYDLTSVTFESPDGWKKRTYEGETLVWVDVNFSDSTANAQLLKSSGLIYKK